MVPALQQALKYCQTHERHHNDEFFVRIALAKSLTPEKEALIASARRIVEKGVNVDGVIKLIFSVTRLEFEECCDLISKCGIPKSCTRAFCNLAAYFPDKREDCLTSALKSRSVRDKELRQIADTFQSEKAVKRIIESSIKIPALLSLAHAMPADSEKAYSLFTEAVALKSNEVSHESLDFMRALAARAALSNDPHRDTYLRHYFTCLEIANAKVQLTHSKQLFKELIEVNIDTAASVAKLANTSRLVAAQAALLVLESPKLKDLPVFTELVKKVRENNESLKNIRYTIRLAKVTNSSKLEGSPRKDFVAVAQWIKALVEMGKKRTAIRQYKKFAPLLKKYLANITVADGEIYSQRRQKLLKAASAFVSHYPLMTRKLVSIALPSHANVRLYEEHIEAIAKFGCKHASLKDEIVTLVGATLQNHRECHLERPDNVALFIKLARKVHPLSSVLSHELLAQVRTIMPKTGWSPSDTAEVLDSTLFRETQKELYEEALVQNPNDIEIMLSLAKCSSDNKEELLTRALDAFCASTTAEPDLFGDIILGFLEGPTST